MLENAHFSLLLTILILGMARQLMNLLNLKTSRAKLQVTKRENHKYYVEYLAILLLELTNALCDKSLLLVDSFHRFRLPLVFKCGIVLFLFSILNVKMA